MTSTTGNSRTPSWVEDRLAVQDVVDGIDAAVDAKDWIGCRRYFTDSIDVDFSSLGGGAPARMPADDLVATWSANLFADKHTQHMRSNYQMELAGDTATVTHTLARTEGGWRCTGMALAVTYARGNETVRTYQPES